MKKAFFSIFDENLSKSLFLAKKSTKVIKKWVLNALLMENALFYAIRMTNKGNYFLRAEQVA